MEAFATETINSLPVGYSYHCLEHTQQVVHNASRIAVGITMEDWDRTLLLISAWLHDIGFCVTYSGHEQESCNLARAFLRNDLDENDLHLIEGAIMATEIPQRPPHLIAEALCDADLLYLGTDQFPHWSGRLRNEHREILGKEYTDGEWINFNIAFVEPHRFYTEFARSKWGVLERVNLQKLLALRT